MTGFTPEEQLLLELANRARLDPETEYKRPGINMTDINQFLPAGKPGFPISLDPRQPLAGNDTLAAVSEKHAAAIMAKLVTTNGVMNFDSHKGAGDGTPAERIKNGGYAQNALANGQNIWPENVGWNTSWNNPINQAFWQTMLTDKHNAWFRDDPSVMTVDPNAPAGHRLALLDANAKEMGVGFAQGKIGVNDNFVQVENFGSSGTQSFLTGAVYNDTVVKDNFYSLGEGVQGVTATVRNTAGTVIGSNTTGSGGGWSVGEPGGTYKVTFTGTGLAAPVAATVDAGNLNAKIDLVNGSRIESSASMTTLNEGAKDLTLLGAGHLNGAGNDAANIITGNRGNNILAGKGGNDTIDGAAGTDTAVFSGRQADYQVTVLSSTSARLVDTRGIDGTDTIFNMEKVQFSDGLIDFSALKSTPAVTPISVSIGDVSVVEGANGQTFANFVVTRSGGSGAFSLQFATADGTATAASGDYVAKNGPLQFAAGVNSQTISIAVNGDALIESNETFKVKLSGAPSGVTITRAEATATITNDDVAGSVVINNVTVTEGANGQTMANFTVTRSGGSAAFDVNFATADGTATAASGDYTALNGPLRFNVGETTKTISIAVKGDTVVEANETFKVLLSGATNGAIIADGEGIATINNDDVAAPVNHAPVVKANNVSLAANTSVAASSLFTATDQEGNATIKQYGFWDDGANGGYFTVNGVKQAAGAWILVDTANLGTVKYVGGANLGNEKIFVSAFDGKDWATNASLTATTTAHSPQDFNGDNASDVLFHNTSTGSVAMWQMDGNKIVSNTAFATIAKGWNVVGTGDFGGDGKADILLRSDGGQVALWQMDGNKITSNVTFGSIASNWKAADVADFNGDGKADILWTSTSGQVAMWQMDGTKIVANQGVTTLGSGWTVDGTGDFDGNGKADILLRHTSGSVAMWQMDGNKIVTSKTFGTIGTDWHFAGAGDIGGDGKDDIIWRSDAGKIAAWQMNGNAIIGNNIIGSTDKSWDVANVGDYNHDGQADLLLQGTNGNVALWQMDGTHIEQNVSVGSASAAWLLV
jgi:hypothetical protein